MHESAMKNLPWNDDTVRALGLYRLIGRILGIWSLNCHDIGSKIRFYIVIALQLSMNYNLLHEFASGCISIADAVDFFALLASSGVSMLKVFAISMHEKEMYTILISAVKDWSFVRSERSCEIMERYAYRGRFISIIPLFLAHASMVPLIVNAPPAIERTLYNVSTTSNNSIAALRNVPLGTVCTVAEMPYFLYLAVYFNQFLQLLCLCMCNMGCDAIFYGISMHLCAQFELLRNDIAALGRNYGDRHVEEDLVVLIRRHNFLLGLLQYLENIFHLTIFGLLAGDCSNIILVGMQMLFALKNGAFVTLVYSPIVITLLLMKLFAYSFVGDCLSSNTENVRSAAYDCCWYDFSSNLGKSMMFVTMRSSRAFHLTAGKIFRINIASFTTILKTMFSYFSIMKMTIVK